MLPIFGLLRADGFDLGVRQAITDVNFTEEPKLDKVFVQRDYSLNKETIGGCTGEEKYIIYLLDEEHTD